MYTVFAVSEEIDHSYFFKLLKTETFRHIFEANTSGSIDRRGALRWDDFANIKIPIPSIEEQKQIADVLIVADEEIDFLTGKLRVDIDELELENSGTPTAVAVN
jgi:type I restriction enzyme, S subunit